MTDRELLELAAKAAEIDLRVDKQGRPFYYAFGSDEVLWNPITDDGDALRLAGKLRLVVDGRGYVTAPLQIPGLCIEFTPDENNIRRAITRAAAELGKEKP